jgi:CheY-like chemotaxis protein
METTILIVDDDEELSGLLSELLQEEGYHVLLAGDGVEAVQAVKQHHPDLVLLDILMPRMDGWETCRWIRELSDTPIIILSCERMASWKWTAGWPSIGHAVRCLWTDRQWI